MREPWYLDPKSIRFRFLARLHRLTGGALDHPRTIESKIFHKERDASENATSTPPDDHHIETTSIWAFDYFTPTNIAELENSFRRLGWDAEDIFGQNEDPLTWLQKSRRHNGGWIRNLGAIRREKNDGFLPALQSSLPPFVEHANAYLYSLTSSISCIAICFSLREQDRRKVEAALRDSYSTIHERVGRGHRVHEPQHQKPKKVEAIRAEWRAELASWMRTHAPGLLSKDETGSDLPLCEFSILDNTRPFPADRNAAGVLLNYTDLSRADLVFNDKDYPAVSFAWGIYRDKATPFAMLTCERLDLRSLAIQHYGKNEPSWYRSWAFSRYTTLLTHWSLLALVSFFERQLSVTRDAGKHLLSSGNTLSSLSALIDITNLGIDTATICPELLAYANDPSLEHDIAPMEMRPWREDDKKYSFIDIIKHNLTERLSRLNSSDSIVKGFLVQQGNLISAYENIRLQKSVRLLTIITLAAGIFSLLAAVISAIDPGMKLIAPKTNYYPLPEISIKINTAAAP